MDNNFIEFKNVTYDYEEPAEDNHVVNNVSFNVGKGEFVAVLGHNGSGKSTLAKLFNGIFTPAAGKVLVEGMDTADEKNEFRIREKVGIVFQNPDNQIVASIVEEDVAFGPENLGVEPGEIRKRVDNALKEVGMYDYRNHETHRLSGGQKQRVAIAGMIAMQPQCIVFDEPTAMLDPMGRKEVLNTAHRLNKELSMSIVYITHFMEEAIRADKILVVDNGNIVAQGSPSEIFSQTELLEKCGLDVPDIVRLADSLRKNGIPLENVLSEEEFADAYFNCVTK